MKIDKVKFERTGGFAGIRLAADIEMDDLPEDQQQEILELLDELDFEDLPEKLSREIPVPDGFVYSISVVSGKKEQKVVTDESALSADMQPLIEMLESITKRQMRKKRRNA